MNRKYSVLMSVYYKDSPAYLRAAIESMLVQTEKADEIILVCDGPLTDEQDKIIEKYVDNIKLLRLEKNQGLGIALSKGIDICKNEWIARMDSDDISVSTRCKLQLDYFETHPEVDVLSGTLAEFIGEATTEKEALKFVTSYKYLPETHTELKNYIRSRNPINHPCVMFRKSKAMEAGGYQSCYLFEDYDLWVRMFQNGAKFANMPQVLLYMRSNHMYERRGGALYAWAIFKFFEKMYKLKMINMPQFIIFGSIRILISFVPVKIRRYIYMTRLRN